MQKGLSMAQQAHSQQVSQVKFIPYTGDLMGLLADESYAVFRYMHENCKILVSISKRGEAANCHFASDRNGLRLMKIAIEDWCDFCFWLFDWCDAVMAIVTRPSVGRLCEKTGFDHQLTIDGKRIYVRCRDGRCS